MEKSEKNKNVRYRFLNRSGGHLHTLDDKPLIGTSTALSILSKPLTYWASGKAVETLGWSNPKYTDENVVKMTAERRFNEIKGMTLDEYIKTLNEAYKAHATSLKDSASKGTDLHAELEHFVKAEMGKLPHKEYDPKIQPFITWSRENVVEYLWSEAHCFSEKMWTGGISDCGAKLKSGLTAIIDFKSSKEAYMSQFLQCAGYALQIAENGLWDSEGEHNKKIEKIDLLIIVPFGAKEVVPNVKYNSEELRKGFENALALYKLIELQTS